MTTTALPTPTGGDATSDVALEVTATPAPPIIVDEPGVLDDDTFVDSGDSQWVTTEDDRESTFALDVDTGSFNVAQAFLANGYRPEPDWIRVEEWVNNFTYGDAPATDADLAIRVESAATDEAGTAIVRVGITSRQLDTAARPPANLTFVVDTSGSIGHPRATRARAVVAGLARSQPAPRRHGSPS